ncbi:2Fe-2S iron-sulfur cluster-binding protein [Paenibacillus arenosi]|uniref:(2Fe-2S)-binding protein n=1 Tax=Paenibacillus arenosi TaxID=2774142 RepID=A0ABR9AU64_9BACL|nr:2Fe-2S iron-sulfur cluster-binding protein [Paenibacillus arenosi]MBD8497639.1 (2Fe-2S)-binding protein [Paenibacillus arenosi]
MGELKLMGRTREGQAEIIVGQTLLQSAIELQLDWQYRCERGTCAQCRCMIEEGHLQLNGITDAEWDRMDEDELRAGYRLACQAKVLEADTTIAAKFAPYY